MEQCHHWKQKRRTFATVVLWSIVSYLGVKGSWSSWDLVRISEGLIATGQSAVAADPLATSHLSDTKVWSVEKQAKCPTVDFVKISLRDPKVYPFSKLTTTSIELPFCKRKIAGWFYKVYNWNTLAQRNEQPFGREKSCTDWIELLSHVISNYFFCPGNILVYAPKNSIFWDICGHVLPSFSILNFLFIKHSWVLRQPRETEK